MASKTLHTAMPSDTSPGRGLVKEESCICWLCPLPQRGCLHLCQQRSSASRHSASPGIRLTGGRAGHLLEGEATGLAAWGRVRGLAHVGQHVDHVPVQDGDSQVQQAQGGHDEHADNRPQLHPGTRVSGLPQSLPSLTLAVQHWLLVSIQRQQLSSGIQKRHSSTWACKSAASWSMWCHKESSPSHGPHDRPQIDQAQCWHMPTGR